MSQGRLEVNYDENVDVLYFFTESGAEEEFVEVAPGFNVELNHAGKVIGIEILNASQVLGPIMKKMKQAGCAVVFRP